MFYDKLPQVSGCAAAAIFVVFNIANRYVHLSPCIYHQWMYRVFMFVTLCFSFHLIGIVNFNIYFGKNKYVVGVVVKCLLMPWRRVPIEMQNISLTWEAHRKWIIVCICSLPLHYTNIIYIYFETQLYKLREMMMLGHSN